MTKKTLISIESPFFSAGVVLNDAGSVIIAAPILHYMVGWGRAEVERYCVKRRWKWEELKVGPSPSTAGC